MSKLMDKMLRLIGFEVEEVEERPPAAAAAHPPREASDVAEEWVEELPQGGRKRGTLVSLPGQKQLKVVVVEPRSFEEVQSIADHLKSRRPIILNLDLAEREHAQRILNFLSGCTYALNGEMQRISNGIFFFAPSNVDVALMRRTVKEAAEGDGAESDRAGGDRGATERRLPPLSDIALGQAKDPADRRGTGSAGGDRDFHLWNK